MLEMVPEEKQTLVGTAWQIVEGFTIVIVSLYFWYLPGASWIWPQVWAQTLNLVCCIIIAILFPESPKWLYDKKKYSQCAESFYDLAKINNK